MDNESSEELSQEQNLGKKQKGAHLLLLRDTSIIIGLVTLMGYLVAYNYQKGYKDFYHIDDIFINDITLTQIVISIAGILGATVTLINLYPLFKNILIFNKENKKWLITRYITQYWIVSPFLILLIIDIYLELSKASLIYLLSIYYLFSALPVLMSNFFNEGRNYAEKFRRNITNPEPSIIDVVKFNIFETTKGFVVGLFLSFILLSVDVKSNFTLFARFLFTLLLKKYFSGFSFDDFPHPLRHV